MKTRNIVASILVILGMVFCAYCSGIVVSSCEGLEIGFAIVGIYGSIAISVVGILVFLIGWIIDKKSKK